ncbi:spinster family MFS transporter [Dictyobacter arantiisoli]|uniref:MFS transporter n=1 Tax=Dictyobacter arantiisoli TaxID=2014874 RepID=A0A5A5T987_9CHLR|nr:MFS transporter [Dictyobacter arantiisoli]GCF07559.1 MFS transporter [Dictyobacter arantiisoli]
MEKKAASQYVSVVKVDKRSSFPRYVFSLFFAISFLNYLDRNIFTGASNAIAKDLHLSLDQIGYIASAFLIIYTLATIPLGLWADRAPRKNIVALCVTIWSIATTFTAFAGGFLFLFCSRMVLGIGEAGYFPAGTALMSDYFHRARRARIMSIWGVAQYMGIFVGFVLGGILGGMGLWREAFLFASIPGLFVAFLTWRIREPRRNQADEEEDLLHGIEASAVITPPPAAIESGKWEQIRGVLTQFRQLLHIKTIVILMIIQIFAFFVLSVNVTYLPLYLQQVDTFHLSQQFTGIYSGGVIVIAGLVGNVSGGYAADLLQRRYAGARILICGICFLVSAPVFTVAIFTRNFPLFSIFFFLTVALLAVYNGPSTAATQDVVPSWLRSLAVAFTLFIGHLLGDAFAPALIGVLATNLDPTHGQHFAQNLAGQDLSLAIAVTCVPALLLAGVAGIVGARWMKKDVETAIQAELAQ